MPRLPPLVIVGPTAVGKSPVALVLARHLGGEIVSVDSMQVYRGMDIGTAKPSVAERSTVRHHLIDAIDLTEPFDAASFVRLATKALAEIEARQQAPILCGGTGLYFQSLLLGLGDAPAADPALRAELEDLSTESLLAELQQTDPTTFDRIDRANRRRLIRAFEVVRLTGRPYSNQRAPWNERQGRLQLPDGRHPILFGLAREKADLWRRINERVDSMIHRGLVEEVQRLQKAGLNDNPTASQALGYKQIMAYLRGGPSLAETIALVKLRTRQYAKRQMTWFRRQLPLQWMTIGATESPETVAERVLSLL